MIFIIAGLWFAFLLGFVGALWLFPRVHESEVCPLCNEKLHKQFDKWA